MYGSPFYEIACVENVIFSVMLVAGKIACTDTPKCSPRVMCRYGPKDLPRAAHMAGKMVGQGVAFIKQVCFFISGPC